MFFAQEVLKDCKFALSILESEIEPQRWRLHWVGAVALVRAVGHVLHKVDGKNKEFGPHIEDAYRRWKENRGENSIFWEFIELERNNILKEYNFSPHPHESVEIVVRQDAQTPQTDERSASGELSRIDSDVYRPMLGEYRTSDDARDVYSDALRWWADQLDAIERAIVTDR